MKKILMAGLIVALGICFFPQHCLALSFGYLLPNVNDAYGNMIDHMYSVIFWIVTIVFLITEGFLVFCVIRYRSKEGRQATYTHGNKYAEIIWTVIPAIILIWLAIYQKQTWDFIREDFPPPNKSLTVQVFAQQFAWNFRYADPKGSFGAPDDITTIDQMHVPVGKKVVIHMTSDDVIHDFFVPYARLKQDAVPGMLSESWFEMDKLGCWNLKSQTPMILTRKQFENLKVALDGFLLMYKVLGVTGARKYYYEPMPGKKFADVIYHGKVSREPIAQVQYVQHPFEIACSQLCGIGHYRMVGYLTVDTPASYRWWMKKMIKEKYQTNMRLWRVWDKYYPQYNN
jgi:cytochrome c oxidase subunit 2